MPVINKEEIRKYKVLEDLKVELSRLRSDFSSLNAHDSYKVRDPMAILQEKKDTLYRLYIWNSAAVNKVITNRINRLEKQVNSYILE